MYTGTKVSGMVPVRGSVHSGFGWGQFFDLQFEAFLEPWDEGETPCKEDALGDLFPHVDPALTNGFVHQNMNSSLKIVKQKRN